ncbi:UPF0728 protein C10orf53 homolog [Lampris incognitus]|uniref:UPF0728 protein C10orf53 homolog n=1 Tax=Lampris incognitus TaxID=2546036 RepID=UPI0024B5FB58|nr:UPF0728 protein C10orf53 homolog [Lampris incognitus]
MPKDTKVVVRYGPYESNGLVEHRTSRLQGLQVALREHGHQCVLEETHDWNMAELVVNGESVYTCTIKQLEFGGDGKLDPVCEEAVNAVENAH